METSRCINVVDMHDRVVWHRHFEPEIFDRLQRIFELLDDKEALKTLDVIIRDLEAPKMKLAKTIAEKFGKDGSLQDFLAEALTTLPKQTLEELSTKINKVKMRREAGGDCLIIQNGDEKEHRIHL